MPKKQERRPWTEIEDEYLVRNSGRMAIDDICMRLNRSKASVSTRASQLRDEGREVAVLRFYVSPSRECPECHLMRFKFSGDECTVCHLSKLRDRHAEQAFEAWKSLSKEQQARSNASFAVIGGDIWSPSTNSPKAKKETPVTYRTAYQESAGRDRLAIEQENDEIFELRRQINAMKNNKSKWKRKSKQNLV